jgi:microcystin-dependent protein
VNRGTLVGEKPVPQPYPPGVIWEYAGTTLPDPQVYGIWLWCDGTAYPRGQYAGLFGIIQTNYGAGDGNTTFNVPDRRGRVGVGAGTGTGGGSSGASGTAPSGGSALTARVVGAWVGEETHALTSGEMTNHDHGLASHNHGGTNTDGAGHTHTLVNNGQIGNGVNSSGHSHSHDHANVSSGSPVMAIKTGSSSLGLTGSGDASATYDVGKSGRTDTNANGESNHEHSHNHGGTNTGAHTHTLVSNQGAAASTSAGHNVIQPMLVCNYIIKA